MTFKWYEVLHYKENPILYSMTLVYWLLKQFVFKAAVYFKAVYFTKTETLMCKKMCSFNMVECVIKLKTVYEQSSIFSSFEGNLNPPTVLLYLSNIVYLLNC